MARAQVIKPFETSYPFNERGTETFSSAFITPGSGPNKKPVLTVTVEEGPAFGFDARGFGFLEVFGGTGDDKDSGQIAVRWFKGNQVIGKPVNNVKRENDLPSGSDWTFSEDRNVAIGERYVGKNFDIPEGADKVNIVLIYTDIQANAGPNDDLPFIMGSWSGSKRGGQWIFEHHPEDLPPNKDYRDDDKQTLLINQIKQLLLDRTGHTLKYRSAGGTNTGFDLIIADQP